MTNPTVDAASIRWIGTNWKMHKTLAESLAFADALARALPVVDPAIQPFIIPPFTAVRQVKAALSDTRVKVGAQNMHWDDEGPWTGEISPVMLQDCGLDLVELGHSERREHFCETNRSVGLKTAAALRHGLLPLVCVGETLAERDAGRAEEVLREQVLGALEFVDIATLAQPILFAYEPVWAIGVNGIPASASYAAGQQRFIKSVAASVLPAAPPVLYGGSVNSGNAAELIMEPGIDGLFVGRSAWQAESLVEIMRLAAEALARRSEKA
jgi:triosephosphate isomerase